MNDFKTILLHIRFPLQSFTVLGFMFALFVISEPISKEIVLAFISWFFLCGGITVYNSYYDKDEGPVAGLKNPPPTKKSMLYASWMFKAVSVIIALINIKLFILVTTGVILSVLYSKYRFKSNGYVALIFNFIIGAISFLVVSTIISSEKIIIVSGLITGGLFLSGIYLLMQIHQVKEDKKRGDDSIASIIGKNNTINLAMSLLFFASIAAIITLYLSNQTQVMWIFIVFFAIALAIITKWKKTKIQDFSFMNNVTLFISFTGNIILIALYIIQMYL